MAYVINLAALVVGLAVLLLPSAAVRRRTRSGHGRDLRTIVR
jgi:hypothetical protein